MNWLTLTPTAQAHESERQMIAGTFQSYSKTQAALT